MVGSRAISVACATLYLWTSVNSFQSVGWKRSRTTQAAFDKRKPGTAQCTALSESKQPRSSSALTKSRKSRRALHKDVVIVGAGLAGLSVALYLSEIDPSRQITILDKEPEDSKKGKTAVASFAAAGMLAPQSERLPKGNYLDLCLASKRMYPEFVDFVETMARESGEEGAPYLWGDKKGNGLEPWNIGYVASGGFLAPAFAGDGVATWTPPEGSGSATWLDAIQVRELEPNLNPKVIGGWWFPEDSSVDARRLTCSLRAACVGAGVQFLCGSNYEVGSLDLAEGKCDGIWLKNGRYISANDVLVANGAWMRHLLPVPLEPHKGQSLSLRMPQDKPPMLRRVLFAQDSYIVPKADGRIVIGATVEAGSFDPNVTPGGIMHILHHALELVPGLKDLPLEETWAGLRPTTPDKGPIMGKTPWEGLYLAGGYWRNGVLLAPKTGELLASLIADAPLSDSDSRLLDAFAWNRFTSKEGGSKLAAEARFAASMYPVHTRKSGSGVAASVGTELGSYSKAPSAKEEREKDRSFLSGSSGDDDLERAASQGQEDAKAYFGFSLESEYSTDDESDDESMSPESPIYDNQSAQFQLQASTTSPYDGPTSDAITVGAADNDASRSANRKPNEAEGAIPDMLPVEKREAAEYTSYEETSSTEDSQQLCDGYTAIEEAAKADDARESFRKSRIANRLSSFGSGTTFDESNYPDYSKEAQESSLSSFVTDDAEESSDDESESDLSSIYEQIRQRKSPVEISEPQPEEDDRPDPGFRIWHVDKDTREVVEIPPYTRPEPFIAKWKEERQAVGDSTTGTSVEDIEAFLAANGSTWTDDDFQA